MKAQFYFIAGFFLVLGCSAAHVRSDEEARSAVEAIREAVSTTASVVKYCPVTGKRYSPRLETCPVHGVTLENVE